MLDVGCGRGAALFILAEAIGASGHVTGIDLSTGMIEALTADIEQRGVSNVDVRVVDAAAPDLVRQAFDAVTASLVVFFFPDPVAALRAWRELLVPEGRLAISTFGPQDPTWIAVDVRPFASDAGVEALAAGAGFAQLRATSATVTAVLRDLDHWGRVVMVARSARHVGVRPGGAPRRRTRRSRRAARRHRRQ